MGTTSDPRTLVLHGLRLKGFAEAPAVAEAVGVPETDAKPLLDQLVVDGLASYRDGRISGFTLTPAGRAAHSELVAAELDGAGQREAVNSAYRRFLDLNGGLLGVCTDWQLRDTGGTPEPNDHGDPTYDAGVVDRLADLHARVVPVCHDLAASLDRYGWYLPRLAAALERVQAGDTDWFTKPMIASYHTVWFELHEDLLSTLGIERSSEVAH